MTIDTQTWSLLASLTAAFLSAWTRAAIAELRLRLTKEQERRCAECEARRFAGRREFDQLERRVANVEEVQHG